MAQTELLMLAGSFLLLLGILASKISSRLGIPALVLFLAVGMLAGSEGPGGIHFDDPRLVQTVGVFALAYILFAGGLDTNWRSVRPVLREGMALSTLGVAITALLVGWFVHATLDFSWREGLLLGAIVSSTDAAAVFAVLRSRGVNLRGNLKPLLELESGSNDPMAVFLTLGMVMLLTEPTASVLSLAPMVIWQMAAGAAFGYLSGKGAVILVNRLRLDYEGLYSVLTLTLVPFIYGLASLAKANGFLAVYLAGMVMGNSAFVQKKSLLRFHDGLAWLMQIAMFLVLGLQVFPSHLLPVVTIGLAVAAFLMLIARPASVFVALSLSRLSLQEKGLISWVGLRGAVPIVLATFPLLADIGKAETIFNMVFFIVLTSALLQGSSIPLVARWLKLEAVPHGAEPASLSTGEPEVPGTLYVVSVSPDSAVVGRQLVDLGLPAGVLVVYIQRGNEYLVPGGSSVVSVGDRLHLLVDSVSLVEVERCLAAECCPVRIDE
ncbi:MAG TPA: potassium/proton antiporter [Desulfuromonadales bacterium]|nr:potassium/proton antiporter [Desulfuromonadales bacterium]